VIREKSLERLYWVDAAKAYGICLVFYGQLIQSEIYSVPLFLSSLKFVYSFHMPLFFILSGYVATRKRLDFTSFVKKQFSSRIVPILFFNLLILAVKLVRDILYQGTFHYREYLGDALSIASGYPDRLNAVTWFIICLLTVEFYHFWLRRIIVSRKISPVSWFILSWLMVYPLGCIITRQISLFSNTMGVRENFWYVHEALMAYPFYSLGICLREKGTVDNLGTEISTGLLLIISLATCILSYDLNQGPFPFGYRPVVYMAYSIHGNVILFPFTAIAGSIFIIALSSITPSLRIMSFMGRNSLILLGLNGLFLFVGNHFLARAIIFLTQGIGSSLLIRTLSVLGTLLSLLSCIPAIRFINRYVPQLIGKVSRNSAGATTHTILTNL